MARTERDEGGCQDQARHDGKTSELVQPRRDAARSESAPSVRSLRRFAGRGAHPTLNSCAILFGRQHHQHLPAFHPRIGLDLRHLVDLLGDPLQHVHA